MELVKVDEATQEETTLVVTKATELTVTDKPSCDVALCMGKDINALKKRLNEYFGPMVKKAHEAHKEVKSKQNEVIKPLDDALALIKGKVNSYNQELQRVQREEAERVRKEAEAMAEEEKRRLQAEAEVAAEKGDDEAFEKADYEAQQVTPEQQMPVSQPVEKVAGATANWQHRVVNKHALIKAVLDGTAPDAALIPDDKFLRQMSKNSKGTMKIPGVVFEDVGTVRF